MAKAGPSHTRARHAELNHTQPSLDGSDSDTPNGSHNQTELVCTAGSDNADSTCDISPGGLYPAEPGPEPAALQPQQPRDATEEELEEEKLGEACSPCSPANEQPAKRRVHHKRKKSLFTIQAVNSNGTTERGMGEGGSAVSFSCRSTHTHTHGDPHLFMLKFDASVCSSALCGHRLGPRNEEEILQ